MRGPSASSSVARPALAIRARGRKLSHVASAARAVAAESFQPVSEIGVVPSKSALHHNRSDLRSLARVAGPGC